MIRYLISLVIRDMQNQNHEILHTLKKQTKKTQKISLGKDVDKLEVLYIADGNIKCFHVETSSNVKHRITI